MRKVRMALLALALLALGTSEAWSQGRRDPADGARVRGKVIRVSPTGNSFVVGVEGKEVTLYTGERTTYRHRDKPGRFADVRVGMPVAGVYDVTGDRFIVRSLDLDFEGDAPAVREAPPAAGPGLRGQILRAQSEPNHLVIRTEDGKEVILYLDNRAATFTFETRAGKRILTGINAAVARTDGPARNTDRLSGTIVRTLGEDRFIIRTTDGKETTFYADPKIAYEFDGRAGRFSDLREGVAVEIGFDVRDRRHYANRVIGRRR